MKRNRTLAALPAVLLLLGLLVACDIGGEATPAPTPTPMNLDRILVPTAEPTDIPVLPTDTATAAPGATTATEATSGSRPAAGAVDTAVVAAPPTPDDSEPSPTPVTATSTGQQMTALQALAVLKPKALAWHSDARLGLLANTRPGQQQNLLGDALGKPDINEPTPGGKGNNWTLVVFSPSAKDALALSLDGTKVDLVKAGAIEQDAVTRFSGPELDFLALQSLDTSKLVDSDSMTQKAGAKGQASDVGVALLAPDGLGIGPLPTPPSGGESPRIAYELFLQDGQQQTFMIFDATTGAVVLDSSKQ